MKPEPTYAKLERRVNILEKEDLQLRQTMNELYGDEDRAHDLKDLNAAK